MIFLNLEHLISFNYYGLVEINETAFDKFVKFFKKKNQLLVNSAYDWIDDRFWLDPSKGPEINSQYFTVGNSINFKFWKFSNSGIQHVEGTKGHIKCKGSSYMWRCLKDCYDNNDYEILKASFLAQIEIKDMMNIFKTDEGKNVMTHLEERWLNWRDLGKKLLEKYNNKFYTIILKSENDLETFLKSSKEFRAFDDPIYKMIMVNTILHQGRKIVDFGGDIFPGIDYHLMTQSLRLGLLNLNTTLEKKLINKVLLDNCESLALRKATLSCLIRIAKELNITGDIIDNIFFKNGKKYCTHNLSCEKTKNECLFKDICKKKTQIFMPLEKTRYY